MGWKSGGFQFTRSSFVGNLHLVRYPSYHQPLYIPGKRKEEYYPKGIEQHMRIGHLLLQRSIAGNVFDETYVQRETGQPDDDGSKIEKQVKQTGPYCLPAATDGGKQGIGTGAQLGA